MGWIPVAWQVGQVDSEYIPSRAICNSCTASISSGTVATNCCCGVRTWGTAPSMASSTPVIVASVRGTRTAGRAGHPKFALCRGDSESIWMNSLTGSLETPRLDPKQLSCFEGRLDEASHCQYSLSMFMFQYGYDSPSPRYIEYT